MIIILNLNPKIQHYDSRIERIQKFVLEISQRGPHLTFWFSDLFTSPQLHSNKIRSNIIIRTHAVLLAINIPNINSTRRGTNAGRTNERRMVHTVHGQRRRRAGTTARSAGGHVQAAGIGCYAGATMEVSGPSITVTGHQQQRCRNRRHSRERNVRPRPTMFV